MRSRVMSPPVSCVCDPTSLLLTETRFIDSAETETGLFLYLGLVHISCSPLAVIIQYTDNPTYGVSISMDNPLRWRYAGSCYSDSFSPEGIANVTVFGRWVWVLSFETLKVSSDVWLLIFLNVNDSVRLVYPFIWAEVQPTALSRPSATVDEP